MSKLLPKVLGHCNRELAAELARAEQDAPALYDALDDALPEPEQEEYRYALLLALTYLKQLRRLLGRRTSEHQGTERGNGSPAAPGR